MPGFFYYAIFSYNKAGIPHIHAKETFGLIIEACKSV